MIIIAYVIAYLLAGWLASSIGHRLFGIDRSNAVYMGIGWPIWTFFAFSYGVAIVITTIVWWIGDNIPL